VGEYHYRIRAPGCCKGKLANEVIRDKLIIVDLSTAVLNNVDFVISIDTRYLLI